MLRSLTRSLALWYARDMARRTRNAKKETSTPATPAAIRKLKPGWSLTRIATASGVQAPHLSRITSGKRRLTLDTAVKIATGIHVSLAAVVAILGPRGSDKVTRRRRAQLSCESRLYEEQTRSLRAEVTDTEKRQTALALGVAPSQVPSSKTSGTDIPDTSEDAAAGETEKLAAAS